jgi:hypothetical protein
VFLTFDRTIAHDGDDLDVDIYWVDAGVIERLRRQAISGAN